MSGFKSFINQYTSYRWRLCYTCTTALLLLQILRVDLSMAFVCMVKTPNRTTDEEVNLTRNNEHCSGSENNTKNQDFEGELEWSNTLQSNILAGYFYGYIATNVVGGALANRYGGKKVLGCSIISASIVTIVLPSLSRISGYFTLVLRILTGLVSAPMCPAFYSIFKRWAPPQEISSFVGVLFSGQILGNIIGFSVSGYLCKYGFDNGWGSIFYIFGGISLLFSFLWFHVVYDTPDLHPTINEEERSFLNSSIFCGKRVKTIPWRRLFFSPAVWAINLTLFAYNWIEFSFQVLLPLYMKEALNVKNTSNGLMSSAPSVGQIIALPLCGKFADILSSKNYISTRSLRVLFQTSSLIGSACLLIGIGFVRCDHIVLIGVLLFISGITLSLGIGGVLVNNIDIAPMYAGVIYGIANGFSAIAGSVSSLSAKALTPNGTHEEWQIVLALFAAVSVFGAIMFATLARADIQDWAIAHESRTVVHPVHSTETHINKNV